jgi:hypothetical protein
MQPEERLTPKEHSANLGRMLTEIIDHAREDIEEVSEPKAQALFETIAETLTGLSQARQDYEDTNDLAWRKAS